MLAMKSRRFRWLVCNLHIKMRLGPCSVECGFIFKKTKNNVDPDQRVLTNPSDQDLHCFPFLFKVLAFN